MVNKSEKFNKYEEKYLLMLNHSKTSKQRVAIINKIYQDGFEDGVNSKEE